MLRIFSPFILVCTVLSLAACVVNGERPNISLPAAGLPTYTIGESLVFTDGSRETVISAHGDDVIWRTDKGSIHEANLNPFVSYHSWQNATRRGRGWIDGDRNLLWPLEIGKFGHYELNRDVANNDGSDTKRYHESWDCKVPGTTTVTWQGRPWSAYIVECNRYYYSRWKQTRRFTYVPAIGANVTIDEFSYADPPVRKDLSRIEFDTSVLSAGDRKSLVDTVQRVLRGEASKAGLTWRARSMQVTATVMALDSVTGPNGQRCRHYMGIFRIGNREFTNPRSACLAIDGSWKQK